VGLAENLVAKHRTCKCATHGLRSSLGLGLEQCLKSNMLPMSCNCWTESGRLRVRLPRKSTRAPRPLAGLKYCIRVQATNTSAECASFLSNNCIKNGYGGRCIKPTRKCSVQDIHPAQLIRRPMICPTANPRHRRARLAQLEVQELNPLNQREVVIYNESTCHLTNPCSYLCAFIQRSDAVSFSCKRILSVQKLRQAKDLPKRIPPQPA
jgi:hypothetical protein